MKNFHKTVFVGFVNNAQDPHKNTTPDVGHYPNPRLVQTPKS